jgi:hypothetical protein
MHHEGQALVRVGEAALAAKDNNRENPHRFRDTLTRLVRAGAMPYEKLTA